MSEPPTNKARRLDLWLYGVAGVLAIVGIIVAVGDRPSEEAASDVAASDATAAVEPAEEEPPAEHEPEEPAIVPNLPEVPDLATQPPPPRPEGTGDDPRLEQLGAEMRYLGRARELLEEHPAEAIGLLEQHRRAHPNGILREEREAFAIEALVSLGHQVEAERRYYDFMSAYPSSTFAPRLRTLMR